MFLLAFSYFPEFMYVARERNAGGGSGGGGGESIPFVLLAFSNFLMHVQHVNIVNTIQFLVPVGVRSKYQPQKVTIYARPARNQSSRHSVFRPRTGSEEFARRVID